MAWIDWKYRKSVPLSRATGLVSNYQMEVVVHRSAGSDSGKDVYIGTKCETDYDDIRFTQDDGTTLLDYWIEESDSASATIWVEFDEIETGATTFYMYYGNVGAAAYSNGDDTFQFFDAFPTMLDSSKWTTVQGAITTDAGKLEIIQANGGTRGLIEGKTGISIGAELLVSAKWGTVDDAFASHFCAMRSAGDWDDRVDMYGVGDSIVALITKNNGTQTATSSQSTGFTVTDYNTYRIQWYSGHAIYYGSAEIVDHTTNIPDETMYPVFYEGAAGTGTICIDWLAVRKFEATEPAWGSWGSEEASFVPFVMIF